MYLILRAEITSYVGNNEKFETRKVVLGDQTSFLRQQRAENTKFIQNFLCLSIPTYSTLVMNERKRNELQAKELHVNKAEWESQVYIEMDMNCYRIGLG